MNGFALNLINIPPFYPADFKDRPAAYCLRQSLLRYAHSTSFAPQMDIRIEDVEESLFPVLRMQTLVGENVKDNSLIVENPQISAVYEEEQHH